MDSGNWKAWPFWASRSPDSHQSSLICHVHSELRTRVSGVPGAAQLTYAVRISFTIMVCHES